MENAYKTFLRNYYSTSFFFDFVFAYAIYIVLFNIHGLSIFQISLLLSWWALVAMVFEIPTGALADRWSRKKMLVLAPLIKLLCFLIWFFADGNFYLYALGFVFWAISGSCVSGTTEAFLYDTLAYFKKNDEYEKILGRKNFYCYIALAIALITGGFIASYELDWAVVFSIIPLLFSAFFALLIKEVPILKSTGETRYLEYIKIAFREVKSNKILLYLFIYLLSISVFDGLEEFDQLYYQLAQLPLFAFGIAGFILSLSGAIGSYYAYKFKGFSPIFYLLPFVSAFCLIFVSRYPSIPMIALLLFSCLITLPLKVLIEGKIQHNIKSVSRATVTSVGTLFFNFLIGFLLAPIFGLISKIWNLQAIYLTTAIFLFVFAFWVFSVRNSVAAKTANGR